MIESGYVGHAVVGYRKALLHELHHGAGRHRRSVRRDQPEGAAAHAVDRKFHHHAAAVARRHGQRARADAGVERQFLGLDVDSVGFVRQQLGQQRVTLRIGVRHELVIEVNGHIGNASHIDDGELREQWSAGDLQLLAARNHGVSGESVFWSGAATWLGGDLRAARQVSGSFAMVDVAGIADVPVYVDHQLVAHTDAQGHALLPDLLPYEANRVNIEPVELPLDTSIGARTLAVTPRYRSGIVVKFPVERVRGGTFRLVNPDGTPVPAGAVVQFMERDFPVTYDGVTYVTGFDHGTAGSAQWSGGHCSFRLDPPPPDDPLPDMGTVVCRPLSSLEVQP